ncbi:MAG: hypothetical protein ABR886_04330 [Dehalococcoidales bacterium]|jgi:hypothetical protein
MRKIATFIFILIIGLVLIPRLTSIAYSQDSAATKPSVPVTAAEPSAVPAAVFYGHAIGSISPSDLFYVDATGKPTDITLSLYITNTDELIHHLRYLTLRVSVEMRDADGRWTNVQTSGGQTAETYLTLQNSPVIFNVPGGAYYKATILSGCYYCLSAPAAGEDIQPRFYLQAETE